MDSSNIAIVVSIIVAILGGVGGIATLLKVSSDNTRSVAEGAKSVSEGAKSVVDMMNVRMDDQEIRLTATEKYLEHFDVWADRLLDILERAIAAIPVAMREEFAAEFQRLKDTRPKREGKHPKVTL